MSEELDLSLVKKWTLEEMVEPESAEGSPKKSKKLKAIQWGFPGHLTQQELGVYVKFQKEVETRGGEFKNTVFSFSELEGEAHTLTRWLRARKYNLADTIAMVSEATEVRAEPRSIDYYPNAHDVLGVDPSIFVSQYPQLYAGVSKTGVPVFYSKTGVLNINGIECITTLEGILKFHWHVMQHDFKKRLLERKKVDPSFVRFECVTVMDLKGLSMGSLNKRTLEIIKKQAFVDSLCFPETMNKMVIVNAPKFFSATWSIIKGFLDARTAAKVELFSSSSAAEKCLRELIDLDQLPKDYGGKAESTDTVLEREASKDATDGGRTRLATNVFYVRSSDSFKFTLAPDEAADLVVYTKSNTGASFKVTDSSTKKAVIPAKTVIHKASNSDNVPPTVVQLNEERISGVSEVKVKAEGLRSQMSYECYLLAVNVFKK